MNKKMILGIALALVLVSGGFFSAQAQCGCLNLNLNPCNWHFCNLFSCSTCASDRDKDLAPYNPFPQSVHSLGVTGSCCQGPAPAIQ